MVSSYIRPCLSDVMEKLEKNLGCKGRVWFDEALCGEFLMVRDEHADIAGGRVCQIIETIDSPFSWL